MGGKSRHSEITYLNFMRTIQEVHEKKQELQKCLSDGFFTLSKARYIMGVDRVSRLHYSPVMQSTVKAHVRKDNDDNIVFDVCKGDADYTSASDNTDGVRRRKSDKDAVSVEKSIADLNVSEDDETTDCPDPIKWFGVLVPRTLRDSQANFQKATVITGEICTLNEKLKHYEKLLYQIKNSDGESEQ